MLILELVSPDIQNANGREGAERLKTDLVDVYSVNDIIGWQFDLWF